MRDTQHAAPGRILGSGARLRRVCYARPDMPCGYREALGTRPRRGVARISRLEVGLIHLVAWLTMAGLCWGVLLPDVSAGGAAW